MAEADYGGYGGGGYSPDYVGGSPGVYSGDLPPLEQVSLESWGPVANVNVDTDFDSIGALSPLVPMDVGSPGGVANVTAGEPSGWENVLGIIDKITKNPLAQAALAKTPFAPLVGIYNLARASQTPQGAAKAFGGMFGSTLGGAVAGQAGSMLGGLAGQYAGSKSGGLPGYTGTREAPAPEGGTMDLAGTIGSLGQLYQANRAAKEAGGLAGTLGDLYGQGSPYAQALRQQMERRDAAAGRRSQYGPREVELQAKLAQLYSQNAPQTMAAQNAAREARNRMFGAGLGLARETGLLDWGQRSLRNLWDTPTDMSGFYTPSAPVSYTPSFDVPDTSGLGTGGFGTNDFFLNY